MARPRSDVKRGKGHPVRLLALERRFFLAAAEKESAEVLTKMGLPPMTLAAFLRAAGKERAARILGLTLEEFGAQDPTEGSVVADKSSARSPRGKASRAGGLG